MKRVLLFLVIVICPSVVTAEMSIPLGANSGSANPSRIGSSVYPSFGAFHYNSISALLTTTLGAKTGLFGVASQDVPTNWPNSYIGGVDTKDIASVYSISPLGGFAGAFATRSSDSPYVKPHDVIGNGTVAVVDNKSVPHLVWGHYTIGHMTATAASTHFIGHEISFINDKKTTAADDPFAYNGKDSVTLLRLDNGTGVSRPTNTLSSGISIVNNGGKFYTGLVVGQNSLDATLNANPPAVSLPDGYSIAQWYSAAGTPSSQIYTDNFSNLAFRTRASSRISFYTGSVESWRIDKDKNFLAGIDNARDIGANGTNRPRSIYAGTSVVTPATGYIKTVSTTVSSLPSASTAGVGARAFVSDANICTFGAMIAGGGATACPVFSDGNDWRGG